MRHGQTRHRLRRSAQLLVLGLVAVAASEAMAQDPQRVENDAVLAIVNQLLSAPPERLSAVEAAVGPLQRDAGSEGMFLRRTPVGSPVRSMALDFAIDIYHQDPAKTVDPRVRAAAFTFETGRRAAVERLTQALGEPLKIGRGLRFDTQLATHPGRAPGFYVRPSDGDGMELAWHATVPEFAQVRPSADEAAAMMRTLIALCEGGMTRVAVTAELGPLRQDPGRDRDVVIGPWWTLSFEPAGADTPVRWSMVFSPPVAAGELFAVLDLANPVAISTDVHQRSREVRNYDDRAKPRLGAFELAIDVAHDGLTATDLEWPASAVWALQAPPLVTAISAQR